MHVPCVGESPMTSQISDAHSVSATQPRQAWVVASQNGVAPLQSF
jgi:hypothetical protein